MSKLDELSEKWVEPSYLEVLHANYCRHTTAEARLFDQFVSTALAEIDEVSIAELLVSTDELEEVGWREQLTASWLCGLKGWHQFTSTIGRLLLASEMCYAGQGFCFALACFATEQSAQYLAEYLTIYLAQPNLYYDQDWAMPALIWIDEQLGTSYATPFLATGGLWERYTAGKTEALSSAQLKRYKQSFWEAMEYCKAHFLSVS